MVSCDQKTRFTKRLAPSHMKNKMSKLDYTEADLAQLERIRLLKEENDRLKALQAEQEMAMVALQAVKTEMKERFEREKAAHELRVSRDQARKAARRIAADAAAHANPEPDVEIKPAENAAAENNGVPTEAEKDVAIKKPDLPQKK